MAVLLGSLLPAHAVIKSKDKALGEVSEDQALVYFIRSPDWGRSVESLLYVYSDEQFLGVLAKNSYMFVHLDPGMHYLWHSAAVREKGSTDLTSTRELELKAGHEYFVVMNFRVPPHVFFAVVSEVEGRALVKSARSHTTAEEQDRAYAEKFRAERLVWLDEMKERRDSPDVLVRRLPEEEGREFVCAARTVFVEQPKITDTGKGRRLSDADDFGDALRKRIRLQGYEVVLERDTADAVMVSTVDKVRTETRGRSYKYVSQVQVALHTLDGQEAWAMELNNLNASVKSNAFNTWSQLARRAIEEMRKQCKAKHKAGK
jgi:hypothetical protein